MEELKRCVKCKGLYPATREFFYVKSQAKDGLSPYCKTCRKAIDAVYRARYTAGKSRVRNPWHSYGFGWQGRYCQNCGHKIYGANRLWCHDCHTKMDSDGSTMDNGQMGGSRIPISEWPLIPNPVSGLSR